MIAAELVCPRCRRFYHGPPGRLPYRWDHVCDDPRHNGGEPAPAIVVVDAVDPFPITLEATAKEIQLAEREARKPIERKAKDVDATPRRDPFEQSRDSFVCEQLVARYFGLEWTGRVWGAVDVGGIYETRAIWVPTHGLVARARDRDLPTFCVFVDLPLGTILGWEFPHNVRVERHRREGSAWGSSGYWILPQNELRRDHPAPTGDQLELVEPSRKESKRDETRAYDPAYAEIPY